jgi:hypothetical protein
MMVQIDNLETNVTVAAGDLPLTPEQIQRLVEIVLKELERRQRAQARGREATGLRGQSAPPAPGAGGSSWA